MTTRTRPLAAALLGFGWLLVAGGEEPRETLVKKERPIPGKPIEEYRVVVTAKPEIRKEDHYDMLLLPAVEGRTIEVFCDREYSWYRALNKEKELTFAVWQTKEVLRHMAGAKEDFIWRSEIETITDGSTGLYDAAICPLHHTRMKRGDVEISYGLPMREFMDALKDFSGGPGFTLGGCVVTEGSPQTERGYLCDECVALYQRWEKKIQAELAERLKKREAEADANPGG
jgi:hypothetical protein